MNWICNRPAKKLRNHFSKFLVTYKAARGRNILKNAIHFKKCHTFPDGWTDIIKLSTMYYKRFPIISSTVYLAGSTIQKKGIYFDSSITQLLLYELHTLLSYSYIPIFCSRDGSFLESPTLKKDNLE